MGRARQATSTAGFGSSRREAHDASAFYQRFVTPEVSPDAVVAPPGPLDVVHRRDARVLAGVPSSSVALVVTSPPYFAGKEYEQSLGIDGVPATYFEYLAMLRTVFAECKRVLEPGGRIAVNVANLGRRPYRSLAGDVTAILEDLGLLLRGEVVWWKGRAAGGSCAWGTFQRPSNPVLRDVTERIVIASKGRFDRALKPAERRDRGLPSIATISRDEFLEATTDLWELPPESATRVGHPAPFPVELPQRLIELYTYRGDVVLDPFLGSGTTAVAAVRTDRRYVGFETDTSYVEVAERRIAEERARVAAGGSEPRVEVPAGPAAGATAGHDAGATAGDDPAGDDPAGDDAVRRALRDGRQAREVAGLVLEACGFAGVRTGVKVPGLGLELDLSGLDADGGSWLFEVVGGFTTGRAGLRRADALWRTIGRAAVLHQRAEGRPLVVLTTRRPAPGSAGHAALAEVTGPGRPVHDVVDLLDPADVERLRSHARRGSIADGAEPTATDRP